ncbi:hypothetical protein [Streptomyces antibioticus]|uniref:hypothetical protein n=1 Tax=Streptomyces antibioticus TaxID=1890 RepID=UPI0033D034FC
MYAWVVRRTERRPASDVAREGAVAKGGPGNADRCGDVRGRHRGRLRLQALRGRRHTVSTTLAPLPDHPDMDVALPFI